MPSTYIYALVFFALVFFMFIAAAGAFKGLTVSTGNSNREWVNSPVAIHQYIMVMNFFGIIVIAALMGQATYQDVDSRMDQLFYTKPIKPWQYLAGRFLGAFAVLFGISLSAGVGAWLATLMPFVEQNLFGPVPFSAYLMPYLTGVLPNIFFVGALFFGLAALSRRIFPVYVGGVVLLIGYLIGDAMVFEVNRGNLAAMLDPYGFAAVDMVTKYWSVAEKNSQFVPLSGVFLWNRLLWCGVGAILLAASFLHFSFEAKNRGRALREAESDTAAAPGSLTLSPVKRRFASGPGLFLKQTRLHLRETMRNIYFPVIVLCGVLFMAVMGTQVGRMFGTNTYPVTYLMIEFVGSSFKLFLLIIITFYAGELTWRERDAGISQIDDVLPVPDWLGFASKTTALFLIQVILLAVVMFVCMVIQSFYGYTRFEAWLYIKGLFGLRLPELAFLCILAMVIQTLVNRKFLGYFLMILYYVLSLNMAKFGFEHRLLRLFDLPGAPYSDMNGFGHYLLPRNLLTLYWGGFALLLILVLDLFWLRGVETGWKKRWSLARQRLTAFWRGWALVALVLFAATGSFIYYNTNVLNRYETAAAARDLSADREKTYKKYADAPRPTVASVYAEVDLFPERREVHVRGRYGLENRTAAPLDEIILEMERGHALKTVNFGREARATIYDDKQGFFLYKLDSPLAPGEKLEMNFVIELSTPGFPNADRLVQVVHNGTFINNFEVFPLIGYTGNGELADNKVRKRHGLADKPRLPDFDDPKGREEIYITGGSDRIDFEAVVSTSPDQIALAPGYLQRTWEADGRRYFHYKQDSKIWNFYSFVSARYEVARDKWNEVDLEIYHHPQHRYNLAAMMDGMKESLTYFSANFSPYQHRQVRIIEFPRYRSFAQSFPNTIPFSESMGFIARVNPNDKDDLDYPYYVTAHEVAHQWWAHQVCGAHVQGATVLTETLAQYSALMVMKHKFGEEKMKRFLRYELDRYLSGRGNEVSKELPLVRNEDQAYIHYNKGSMVTYALQDYIGEEAFNRALAAFLRDWAFAGPPYPNAFDLLGYLRAETPEHLQPLLEDLFETITLFDYRALQAVATADADGRFKVTLEVKARKTRADELGNEEERPLQDWVDIGVFDKDGNSLYLEKHLIDQPRMKVTVAVAARPASAGIDPYIKLIDRQPDDNTTSVRIE